MESIELRWTDPTPQRLGSTAEALLMSQKTLPLRKTTNDGSDCNAGFVVVLLTLRSNNSASQELGGGGCITLSLL
jgi:hypothetical protein